MGVARLRTVTDQHVPIAAGAGWYLSRVSDEYAEFDGSRLQAALDDWGWFGSDGSRRDWHTGTARTSSRRTDYAAHLRDSAASTYGISCRGRLGCDSRLGQRSPGLIESRSVSGSLDRSPTC
jgi:hypothetical protein